MPKKVIKTEKKEIEVLEELVQKLFSLIGLKSKAEIVEDKENDAFVIEVKGEGESGLLIGARGKTLQSIQTVVGLMFRQKAGEWKRIIVNVSDWRQREEERLKDLAEQTAERAKTTGETQSLYNLNPSQRRIIHMELSKDDDVTTESQGEGNDRYLLVSPKK